MIAPFKRTFRHSSSSNLEEQDAVIAASTAIMGENVLDSPNTQRLHSRLHSLRNHSTLEQPYAAAARREQSTQMLLIPSIERTSQSRNDVDDPNGSSSETTYSSANDTQNIVASSALSVGIMAQGLAWAQMQKNRRKQLYLQHQAEQQLEKIRLAEEQRRAAAERRSSASLWQYVPSLQSIARLAGLSSAPSMGAAESSTRPTPAVEASMSPSGAGYSVALSAVSGTRSPEEETHSPEDDDDDDTSWIPPVRVEEEGPSGLQDDSKFGTCPYIVSPDEMHQIAIHVLPRNIAYCKWKRCYSLARDGDSFATCLRAIEAERQTLLVVRTRQGARFGGYADAPWEGHGIQGSANYGGGPEACLFRIVPATDPSGASQIICYRWTGANRYIQLCDVRHKMLAFGGGGSNGAFGLCLEQDFQYGSSGTCATFDNDPLCEEDEQFQIVDLEIYGFLLGQF
jgi:TLD